MAYPSYIAKETQIQETRAKYDEALQPFNRSAPRPFPEETHEEYSRRALPILQNYAPGLQDVKVHDMRGSAFNHVERQTFEAARTFHHKYNPSSAHNLGLAFDASTKSGDYEGSRKRMRAYLNSFGFKEGDADRSGGDYWIEPGTGDHIHVQFNSRDASERYYKMMNRGRDAPKHAALHIGNMSHFQQDAGMRVHVSNPAGANVAIHSGMMGNASGGYGMS